ncbi:hypothetical protein ACF1DY_06250 [Streptomyces albus]
MTQAARMRRLRAVRMHRLPGNEDGTRPPSHGGRIRRRFAFVSWTMAVHLLKGIAFAGGGVLFKVLLSRFLGG